VKIKNFLHKEALICYNVVAVSGLHLNGALNGAPAPKGNCINTEIKEK
jgi:hypothetical protein